MKFSSDLKILVYDIETAPIIGYVWGLWDNNVALNQIKKDWHLLSWAAKWYGQPTTKVMYMDQRDAKNVEDDSKILKGIWNLLNEADVVLTQNGRKFDQKKLNARFIMNGMQPPSTYKHIDTKQIASRHFGFTSNKLEYLTEKLNVKYKKGKHKKYPGFELWKECLAGNEVAWNELKKYNIYDVLSLEELYSKLLPWDNTVNFNVYTGEDMVCNCGSKHLIKNGHVHAGMGKYQRYRCVDCGSNYRDRRSEKTTKKISKIT